MYWTKVVHGIFIHTWWAGGKIKLHYLLLSETKKIFHKSNLWFSAHHSRHAWRSLGEELTLLLFPTAIHNSINSTHIIPLKTAQKWGWTHRRIVEAELIQQNHGNMGVHGESKSAPWPGSESSKICFKANARVSSVDYIIKGTLDHSRQFLWND
jgi:hypothetical protein